MDRKALALLLALTVSGCVEPVARMNTHFVGSDFVTPRRILVVPAFEPDVPAINQAFRKEMKTRLSQCGVDSEFSYKSADKLEQQQMNVAIEKFNPDAMISITQESREIVPMTDNLMLRYKIRWAMESTDAFRPLWHGDGLFFRSRVTNAAEDVGRKWADDFVDQMIDKTILLGCHGGVG
ncbi:MAG: hypothetical protein K2X44_12660 [Magnetospirillum sp.]|nr:hypothetical protein [Magnetospirillum sp.]